MTLTIAIFMSLVVSLTVTPMMCAYLDFNVEEDQNWLMRGARRAFDTSLRFLPPHPGLVAGQSQDHHVHPAGGGGAECLSARHHPQGLLPRRRTKAACMAASAATRASPSSRCRRNSCSSSTSSTPIRRWRSGGLDRVGAAAGGGATNTGNLFITLKPPAQRGYVTTDEVIDRLQAQAQRHRRRAHVPDAHELDRVRAGGRQGNGSLPIHHPGRRRWTI